MSFASVQNALVTVLNSYAQMLGVVTILRADQLQSGSRPSLVVPQDQCPAVIISRDDSSEKWWSSGIKERILPIALDLWYYAADNLNEADTYDAMLENLEAVLRRNPTLRGLADDNTLIVGNTMLLWTTVLGQRQNPKPFATAGQTAVFHDRVRLACKEEIRT